MATFYGINATLTDVNVPSQKAGTGENIGKVHTSYDSILYPQNVLAIADVVKLFKLPKGARIIEVIAKGASTGTTGIWKVVAEANGVDNAADLLTAVDTGGQAANSSIKTLGAKLGAETQISMVFTEATDAASGVLAEVMILFAMT